MPPDTKECGSYDVIKEGEDVTLHINCENCTFFPSIEDSAKVMAMTMDILAEAGHVTKIIFTQKREYEYDDNQTRMLTEIADIYKHTIKQKMTLGILHDPKYTRTLAQRIAEIQTLAYHTLKSDPIGAYMEMDKILQRDYQLLKQGGPDIIAQQALQKYTKLVANLAEQLRQTKLIQLAGQHLTQAHLGNRSLYRRLFSPTIKPDFMYTKLMAAYPTEGDELDSYNINGTDVTIFSMPDDVRYLYHIVPPEFTLSEEKYTLLDSARKILAEYQPKRSEFTDPARMREAFMNISSDLLDDLASYQNLHLREKEKQQLAEILVRYTVGFGLIEVLLDDEKIQDVSINSPMGRVPIFIVHQDYSDCMTNVIPTPGEADSWASKLRMVSGRPLDEANPILDTELELPRARARVATITAPLNPTGYAYSFRRHRDKPWTLPLFIKTKTINSLTAGLLSFIIDGARTVLIAGTRSSGKSSLLSAMLIELMRRIRILTIEDTLELPVGPMRDLGYNIQSMKVASSMTRGTTEVPAAEGIRTTLRLGDSSLIVGEVRSTEALALYEAMRVGALANMVAGTIHGDSPYGVFDRVVNDLGVPRTSFKATDIIIVANPLRSADGIHRVRRVTSVTEIRKHWEDDPMTEGGFVELLKYDSITDQLQPTDDLINGDSEILKSIAANVKDWAGNWDAVWDNIQLRAKMKQAIVNTADQLNNPQLLEAEFVIKANDSFHQLSERIKEETGALDTERIFFTWNEWLQKEAKRYHNA